MKQCQWRRNEFSISTGNGRQIVDGFVCGAFGIRLEERRRPVWSVTHLPSGLRATPGGTGFSNVELAKAFAERLMALTDWSCIDRNSANEQLGGQVAAIWNELIMQDVAKTFSQHYGHELDRLWSKSGAPARRHK
jgi:hypothetical protein